MGDGAWAWIFGVKIICLCTDLMGDGAWA